MATVTANTSAVLARGRVRASTNPSPNPLKMAKSQKPTLCCLAASPPMIAAVIEKPKEDLLSANLSSSDRYGAKRGNLDDQYMGCDRWLPHAPKVKEPKSIYDAASLAFIGDCVYELYARRHCFYPPLSICDLHERVMKVVRSESQDLLLKKLLAENYLTEEERDVVRWGRNKSNGKTKTSKRVGVAIYNSSSSLETLIGYLYLTDVKRLDKLMYKLGFSTGASSKDIAKELHANFRKSPAVHQNSSRRG